MKLKPHQDLTIFLTLVALALGFLGLIYIGYQMTLLKEVMAADFKIDIVRDEKITNELLSKTYGNNINVNRSGINSNINSVATRRGLGKVTATVTAYSELDTCPNRPCRMANGKIAQIGDIACPRALKLDTKVEIEGTLYTCSDRTAKKYDGRYDIWTGTGVKGHLEAIKWGKRRLEVRIIK